MTNEEKQALITKLKLRIAYFEELEISGPESFNNHQKDTLNFYRIALAALTAQPVKLPHQWVHIRFTDRSKNQSMKCQIAWSDSLNSVIYDEEGAPCLLSNGAFEVIRAGEPS